MNYKDSRRIIDSLFRSNTGILACTKLELDTLRNFSARFQNAEVVDKDSYVKNASYPQIVVFERPDLVIEFDSYILAIEHFEADSSKRTSKGSKYKQKYNNRYFLRKFEETEKRIIDGSEVSTYSEKISTSFRYAQLCSNILNSANDHYEKINDYKENISEVLNLNKDIYTIFFIDVKVIFPSFIETDKGINFITPLEDPEFIRKLRDFSNIEGLILHYDKTSNLESYNKFIMTDCSNLDLYTLENGFVRDFSNISIHDFENPMQTGFVAKIGDE